MKKVYHTIILTFMTEHEDSFTKEDAWEESDNFLYNHGIDDYIDTITVDIEGEN